MNEPGPYPLYVNYSATAHGLDASQIRLHHDAHDAVYIQLSRNDTMSIRIQLRPHGGEETERHAASLERDRQGLLSLAALATQVAQEIEQIQQEGGAS